MFANLRNKKKPASRGTSKGKEKVNDDIPRRSKRQRNEGEDPDDQRREVRGLMADARRPARTVVPAQTAPSPRQETSGPTPSFDIPPEVLEQIPTRYLAPLRFLFETFSEGDYVRMMSRSPDELILAQAHTAAYVSIFD